MSRFVVKFGGFLLDYFSDIGYNLKSGLKKTHKMDWFLE